MSHSRRFLAILLLLLATACAQVAPAPDPFPAPHSPDPSTPDTWLPTGPSVPDVKVPNLELPDAPPEPPVDPATAPLDTPIPVTPAVRMGTLDNGLRYFIRQNAKPEERAELRLVIDAGSLLEDDDQQGLAHFIEHMAFNGTERFAKQELVDYLELIGTRFGADLNASTGFDETIYKLKIPTDDDEIVTTAFQILGDWAGGIAFDPEEIDKERGVIIEEWRLGRGAGARLRDEQLPVIFKGSRYAERLPIGTLEVLENAPPEVLERYYRDWYRPDLMAVIAVGDFDPDRYEALIRENFSGLTNPENPRPRPTFDIPPHDETLFSITTDPELTGTSVGILHKHPALGEGAFGDYRRSLVEGIYHGMLNNRLGELAQEADPPFLYASSGMGGAARTSTVFSQQVRVREGELERGLEALLREVERVDRHGFTASELERAKVNLTRAYEQAWRERDKVRSGTLASELIRHFLAGEPVPGIDTELAMVRRFLPTIEIEEVNRLAREWITEENRVIVFSAPEDEDQPPPSEGDLLAVFDAVGAAELDPYVDRVRDAPLLQDIPTPGAVVSETSIEEVGLTEWQLANGVRVILKPTDFQNDQVLLTGFSPGGHSLVEDADHVSAIFSTSILGESGLGDFDRIELGKALAGKVASAQVYISELEEGASGSASPQDLETMFQLLYLNFTAPRLDLEAYESLRSRLRILIENRDKNPSTAYQDRWNEVLGQGHPRRRPLTVELMEEIDPERALEIYRERFADASDFTFILVGNFELDALKPLVETYLGGLPTVERQETWRDLGIVPPYGETIRFTVERGLEPKSQVRLIFNGQAEWSRVGVHTLNTLARVLDIRLREVLREDLGATYGVGVGGSLSRRPRERYSFSISFGCAPGEVDALVETVFHEIQDVIDNGIDPTRLLKVQESQRRRREVDLRENGFWLRALESYYDNGIDPKVLLTYDELVDSVTAEDLQNAAKRYLGVEHHLLGVLDPAPGVEVPKADGETPEASDSDR